MPENKTTLVITEHVDELLYDVENKAHLTARSREAAGADPKAAAHAKAVGADPADGYQLRRSVAEAYSLAKSQLSEYLDEQHTTADNLIAPTIDAAGTLSMAFLLPENFDSAAAEAVAALLHAYIVAKALSQWFAMTLGDQAALYAAEAAAAMEGLLLAIHKRRRPVRPTYNTTTP